MRIGNSSGSPDRVEWDMTPMIDCCFQLIIFFMLSMRIFSAEGDFNIKMPRATSEGNSVSDTLPIQVRMRATPEGGLASIQLGGRTLSGNNPFEALRNEVRSIVGDDRGPGSVASNTEVVLDCDYNLHYRYVIEAITAVSGYIDRGQIIRLIEQVKFAPRRPG